MGRELGVPDDGADYIVKVSFRADAETLGTLAGSKAVMHGSLKGIMVRYD